jgi:membrane protease YdiL (CAAX protease family)
MTLLADPRPAVRSVRSWFSFLVGFAVLCGVLLGTSALDATGRWGLAILAATLLTGVVVERVEHRASVATVLRSLGLGRPGGRALALAFVVSGLVLLVFPLTTAVSGADIRLRADWLWLLIGLFAFHGLAEELVWRGFAFRRLRDGRTFWSATWWTMPLIAASHLPIVFTMGPAVGLGAMAVAAVTSVPFGYLYETGRRSIWAPALVHTAIDTFKLVVIPAAAIPTYSVLIIAVSLTVPLLALVVPRRVLVPASPTTHRRPTEGARSDHHRRHRHRSRPDGPHARLRAGAGRPDLPGAGATHRATEHHPRVRRARPHVGAARHARVGGRAGDARSCRA